MLALRAEVRKVTFLGREAHYMLTTPAGEIVAQVADPSADFIAMEGHRWRSVSRCPRSCCLTVDGEAIVKTGQRA